MKETDEKEKQRGGEEAVIKGKWYSKLNGLEGLNKKKRRDIKVNLK